MLGVRGQDHLYHTWLCKEEPYVRCCTWGVSWAHRPSWVRPGPWADAIMGRDFGVLIEGWAYLVWGRDENCDQRADCARPYFPKTAGTIPRFLRSPFAVWTWHYCCPGETCFLTALKLGGPEASLSESVCEKWCHGSSGHSPHWARQFPLPASWKPLPCKKCGPTNWEHLSVRSPNHVKRLCVDIGQRPQLHFQLWLLPFCFLFFLNVYYF